MFELGDWQHSAVGKMMEESGFQSVEIKKDFRQISRMISGIKC